MKSKVLMISTLGLITINTSLAGPLYSTSCEVAKEIRSPSQSMGYFLSEDCMTAYVLPPAKGNSQVVGRTVGDLGRCSEIAQFNKALRNVNKEINNILEVKADDLKVKALFEQRKYIIEQYSDLSKTLGASIELNFSNGIGDNIKAFQKMNTNTNVNFVPVLLKDVKLAWNQATSFDPAMKIAFNQALPVPELANLGAGSFNARLDLSLIGACPLVDPFERSIPEKLKARDVAGIVTPNITYQYEMGATYKYTAEYNLGALAKKIRETSSSGGLFKTSSSSSLMESAESSGWFKFKMDCDNAAVCDQAKTETANSIKIRLMKEVFDNISLATLGSVIKPVDSSTPGKNGAATASEALKKCPNTYCQAGAIVLDIGNAIFGGTSTTDSYIKTNNHFVKEEVSESRPVTFNGMMGYGQ